MTLKPADFKQGDPRWGALPYAVDGETSTIKSAGCGPTAMADVICAIANAYVDPITTASWARQHGYKVYKSGTSYSFPAAIGAAYGIKVTRINTSNVYGQPNAAAHATALDALRRGDWLIACMGKGLWTSSGHYIVAYKCLGSTVYIADPASSRSDRLMNTWDIFKSQVKYYWIVEVPKDDDGRALRAEYRQEDFTREVQMCCKAGIDGKAGKQTLSKTVTVSKVKNRKHAVVCALQKKLISAGVYPGSREGAVDGIAGNNFDTAVRNYQKKELHYRNPDGEITAGGATWKMLLGIK